MALVLASLSCSACGRVGVEAVTFNPDDDADVDGADEDAGRDELDAEPGPSESVPDASEELDSAHSSEQDAGDGTALSALFLRYDFSGTGTVISDRIGTNHGQVLGGAQLDGTGALTLDGTNDFVNMPNGLISRASSVTVMAWLSWNGGPCWQRIFDFGSSSNGEDNAGNAISAFSLSPSSCPDGVATGLLELNSELRAVNGNKINAGVPTQVALSLDGARGTLTLFLNGAAVGESAVPWQLSQLEDVNNWLGRSQWAQDKFLQGRLDELRIYARALTAEEVATLNMRGPDRP